MCVCVYIYRYVYLFVHLDSISYRLIPTAKTMVMNKYER